MLKKKCSWHGCMKIVDDGVKYCEYHSAKADKENKERYKEYYNRIKLDEDRKRFMSFYSDSSWINLSEVVKRHYLGLCVVCWGRGITENSTTTHHIEELKESWDKRLDEYNLIPLCSSCHQKVHKRYREGAREKAKMKEILYCAKDKFNQEFY